MVTDATATIAAAIGTAGGADTVARSSEGTRDVESPLQRAYTPLAEDDEDEEIPLFTLYTPQAEDDEDEEIPLVSPNLECAGGGGGSSDAQAQSLAQRTWQRTHVTTPPFTPMASQMAEDDEDEEDEEGEEADEAKEAKEAEEAEEDEDKVEEDDESREALQPLPAPAHPPSAVLGDVTRPNSAYPRSPPVRRPLSEVLYAPPAEGAFVRGDLVEVQEPLKAHSGPRTWHSGIVAYSWYDDVEFWTGYAIQYIHDEFSEASLEGDFERRVPANRVRSAGGHPPSADAHLAANAMLLAAARNLAMKKTVGLPRSAGAGLLVSSAGRVSRRAAQIAQSRF